jgi:hypothetical protein
MCIVAVGALDQSLLYPMMERLLEISFLLSMTGEAQQRLRL